MSRILKSRQAIGDLEEIADYIGAASTLNALRFLEIAERAFDKLATMPSLGRAWSRKQKKLAGVRVWSIPEFKHFLIFYRPINDGVEVLRVLHGARNLAAMLKEQN